jgi:elongation factor G
VENFALDLDKGEEKVPVVCDPDAPPVALAFKLEEGKFGQLTYMR